MSGPVEWAREQDPGSSVITYVGGGVQGSSNGHLPLEEVRRWRLAQVEAAEAAYSEADVAYRAAQSEMARAQTKLTGAYNVRERYREELAKAHAALARTLPQPPT